MKTSAAVFLVRLSPVLFVAIATVIYVLKVEAGVAYPFRNLVPILLAVALAAITLRKGDGRWTTGRWMFGTLGFAIPAIGLSIYLHYGYEVDLNGMYSQSVYPQELFRYLPMYTSFAGAIGFAIGWIIGRNLPS